MAGLQATTYIAEQTSNRADFNRSDFETLIAQKGRNCIKEQALMCPCKSKNTNQQSNCKNCGGSGWIFINAVKTKLILQRMKALPEFKNWSEVITGDLTVTGSDEEELCWMDRITSLDSNSIFNEVLFFKTRVISNTTTTFAFTSYNIKELKFVGYFAGVNDELIKLTEGTDFIYYKNVIKLINPSLIAVQGEISLTVRYVHAPQYLIIDMNRESMETYTVDGGDKPIHLPISGMARRQHYILGAPNLNGDNILDNSYINKVYINKAQNFSFTNKTTVSVNHNISKYVAVTVYDQNDSMMTVGVGYSVQRIDANTVEVNFNQTQTGTIVISGQVEQIQYQTKGNSCSCKGATQIDTSNTANYPATPFPFTNQTLVNVRHGFGRYVNVTVYDVNGQIMTANIAYQAQYVDKDNITVTFNENQSGTIVIS